MFHRNGPFSNYLVNFLLDIFVFLGVSQKFVLFNM